MSKHKTRTVTGVTGDSVQDQRPSRRTVSISVCLPATVRVWVEAPAPTGDKSVDDARDWEIIGIREVSCEATARQLGEHMTDCDWEAMSNAIKLARDES